MNTLSRHFAACDLPVDFVETDPRSPLLPFHVTDVPLHSDNLCYVDVVTRRRDSHFRLFIDPRAEAHVLDAQPHLRHLLLFVSGKSQQTGSRVKRHLLLGHDERQLFVVDGNTASSVKAALAGLKPRAVEIAEHRGAKVIRQGDWFFVPLPTGFVPNALIYRQERIGGPNAWRLGIRTLHPHVAEEQVVQYGERYQRMNGAWVSVGQEVKLIAVRGRIRHAEHATIDLHTWHEALPNTAQSVPAVIGYRD